jgi:hypothetical protein
MHVVNINEILLYNYFILIKIKKKKEEIYFRNQELLKLLEKLKKHQGLGRSCRNDSYNTENLTHQRSKYATQKVERLRITLA